MTGPTETEPTHTRRTLLHVTFCPTGGVTRAIELAIAATPHIEHVVMAPDGATRADELGARFVPLPNGRARRFFQIRRIARSVRASAIHAHSSLAGAYVRLARVGVPVLYQPHCYSFSDVTKPRVLRALYWVMELVLTRRTAAVLVLTPHEERQARRLGARTVHYIVNAPTITRRPERTTRRRVPGTRTIAMVGRIAPQKDPALFASVAEAFRDDPTVRFVWIGGMTADDADRGGLAALEQAGVRITGWLGKRELIEELAAADLYLHSAAYEGFPLSLLDACELGVPSVVRSIPSLRECGLPQFHTADEAAILVRAALSSDHELEHLTYLAETLRGRMGVREHNASVAHAYGAHGL